jgi:sialidase-1
MLLAAGLHVADAAPVEFVPVFAGGQDGYGCYRIPALVCTTKGTLLAVADGRISGCGDIPNRIDLVLRRSFDHGRTWGPLQVIAGYGSDPADTDTYPFDGVTNPIPRVAAGDAALLLDRHNGRVWVLYDNGGVVGNARKIKLELRHSDDDGATWSAATDLEARFPGLRPGGGEFLAGPGNGIQLTSGPQAGRLIFPVYIYGRRSSSLILYSDDHGETWRRGGVAGAGGGEIQVAEVPGGGLLASMRDNDFPTTGVRTFSRSADGGLSWGPVYTSTPEQPALPDPANQASLLRIQTSKDPQRSGLVFANAAHSSNRVRMTLRLSHDEGHTWPIEDLIWAGSSAYSALCQTATGDIGLLFERENYTRIDFVRRSVADLPRAADKPAAPAPAAPAKAP